LRNPNIALQKQNIASHHFVLAKLPSHVYRQSL
jgi:hypothetical protein